MTEKNVNLDEAELVELLEDGLEDGDLFTSADGQLRVDGTVFVGSIQRRGKNITSKDGKKKKTANVVKPVGYKITDLKTNKWFFLEKMEAIDLVRNLGVVNATIRPRKQVIKDEFGTPVSTQINLNLHPVKDERPFTDADRLFPVFKLDKNGKIKRPTELQILEEDCTKLLWEVIEEAYKNRKPRGNSKTYRRISKEEKMSRIEQAMKAANFKGAANPFQKD
jgi:hypothetical protein